jgi:hypothetical protein
VLSPKQHQQTLQTSDMQLDTLALHHCFNADASVPRLIFLVSPTCEVCVSGALSAAQAVLSLPRGCAFRLYILWLPVLENDTLQAAEGMRVTLPTDTRIMHFWDHDLLVSKAYHRVLQLGQRQRKHRIAWDLFLLYDVGIVWSKVPPMPAFWMHQLFLDEVPKLDVTILKRQLAQMIRGETGRQGDEGKV